MGALIRCPVCDLLRAGMAAGPAKRAPSASADEARLKTVIVGAAYRGWSLGSDGFKRALCLPHRGEYIALLTRAGASLQTVAEEGEFE
jgi:hypothetical protein